MSKYIRVAIAVVMISALSACSYTPKQDPGADDARPDSLAAASTS